MPISRRIRAAFFAVASGLALVGHADIVVNTDSDADNGSDGVCSLREAITAVNNQQDYHECIDAAVSWTTVSFSIPPNGGELHTIALGSALPEIFKPVFLDGRSQVGTVCAPVPNLRVQITNPSSLAVDGLHLGPGTDASSVVGLAISGFSVGVGLSIDSSYVTVGCVIAGMDATGSASHPNSYGIIVGSNNATIGVATADTWLPNLISGNSYSNLAVGGNNALVAGNYIGVDYTGLTPLPTTYGLIINGSGTRVGIGFRAGPAAHQRNIIGAASNEVLSNNVAIFGASDIVVSGNYIGVGMDGQTVLTTAAQTGISLDDISGILIGCDGNTSLDDCRNLIVQPQGVAISSGATNSGGAIVGNFINVAADGITSLAAASFGTALSLRSDTLVARNVIRSKGTDIYLGSGAKFLNATPAGSGGVILNSSDNCLPDTDAYRGVQTATATTFESNWWGAIDGPQPTGSGAVAEAAVDATPFLTAPSPYCGFDHIFGDNFD